MRNPFRSQLVGGLVEDLAIGDFDNALGSIGGKAFGDAMIVENREREGFLGFGERSEIAKVA